MRFNCLLRLGCFGEQEFYANNVKEGGAVIVVRNSTERSADRAARS
jgi:hypothetical protein